MPRPAAPSVAPTKPVRRTRGQILQAIREAATEAFSSHGFKGASTQAIAAHAGLTKPQLHYYIASKEALYEELLYSILQSWSDAFAFDAHEEDPKVVLSRYVQRKLDYALDHPKLSRIFTIEVLSGGTRLHSYWPSACASTDRKVAVLEAWMAQDRIRLLDARVFIQQIWGMTQYYADYAVQAHTMTAASTAAAPLDRQHIGAALTTSVLLTCGLAPD